MNESDDLDEDDKLQRQADHLNELYHRWRMEHPDDDEYEPTAAELEEHYRDEEGGPMTDEVHKYGVNVSMTDEQIAIMEAERGVMAALDRIMAMSPAERREHVKQMKEQRAGERDTARREPLNLRAVLDKLGWSWGYAAHFVQIYCTCGMTDDGWHYCQHAHDLGLVP